MRREDAADRAHGLVEAAGDVTIGRFQRGDSFCGAVEFLGEPGAIALCRIELQVQRVGAEVAFDASRDRRLKRSER